MTIEFTEVPLTSYPQNILKTFSENAKYQLAKVALYEHKYDELAHVVEVMEYYYSIIDQAIDLLDVKAVETIIKSIHKTSLHKDGQWISQHLIKNLFKNDCHILLNIEDVSAKRIQILQLLLNFKDKKHLTVQELQRLSEGISQQEFEDFCKTKELDLKNSKFKDLELSHYKYKDLEPVLKLEGQEAGTILETILTSVFSDKLTLEQIKPIFTKLYNLDPISKEMITYTAALISKGNNVKIIFSEDNRSYYNAEDNIIKISNQFINKNIFNIASVLIHEIGHFVYQQIFKNELLPFDRKDIFSIVQEIWKKYEQDSKDPFIDDTVGYRVFKEDNIPTKIGPLIEIIMDYQKAARKPFDKAAELLRINQEEYSKYLFADEYTEWFKHNSYIDLFMFAAVNDLKTDINYDTQDNKIVDNIFNNILRMYIADHSEESTCEIEHPYLNERDKIVFWAVNTLLPKVIRELELSEIQVHFLTRIADYVNRGTHWLENDTYYNMFEFKEREKYVELIVRSSEFKASGLGIELTESFKELDLFHINTVSPSICAEIQNSTIVSMPFDIGMVGNDYECLTSEAS